MTEDEADHPVDAGRWRMLLLAAAAELLGISPWFAASAAAAPLAERWALDPSEAAWLTSAVQVGFVVGTALAALLNVADIVPARRYVAVSAALAAVANASLLVAPSLAWALAGRFAVGFCLAGVYPPAMKMVATWFTARRGLAIGAVVGALTVGKASPWLVMAVERMSLSAAVLSSSSAALVAAGLIGLLWRDGPHAFPRRPFDWGLVGTVLRHRPTRLATAGYLGHMWELYAMWGSVGAFLAASLRDDPVGGPVSDQTVQLLTFLAIAIGGPGALWGGWAADRIGRERVVLIALVCSGACSLGVGLLAGAGPWLLLPVVGAWGFFVVADSAQFSALVTEVAPAHAVGTALTIQTSLGFLLTTATLQLVPWVAARWGWHLAFVGLAAGPVVGIEATRRLAALRRTRVPSGSPR